MRRFLPELIQLIWDRKIDPGKVLDFDRAYHWRTLPRATELWMSVARPRSS